MSRLQAALTILVCALAPRAVSAGMIGVELRTDPAWDAAASALLGTDAHIVRLYSVFDGPAGPGDLNVVLGSFNSTIGSINDQAQFYQEGPPHGGDTAPNSDLYDAFPTLEWDTFVSIGKLDSAEEGDTTALYPDYDMGPNYVLGGWYNSYPPNQQGVPDEDFAVFLSQFAILGLPPDLDAAAGPDLTVYNTVLTGTLTVSHNSPGGPVNVDVLLEELIDCNGNGIPDHQDIAEGTSDDGNFNGVPDECEVCLCGDIDQSGKVNLNDFATFTVCYLLTQPAGQCNSWRFGCSDLDVNGTVNLVDFATFALLYGVTPTSSPPNCLDDI